MPVAEHICIAPVFCVRLLRSLLFPVTVNSTGDRIVSGGNDRSLRVWEQTDEQVFLEEEREKEMDEMFEAGMDREHKASAAMSVVSVSCVVILTLMFSLSWMWMPLSGLPLSFCILPQLPLCVCSLMVMSDLLRLSCVVSETLCHPWLWSG